MKRYEIVRSDGGHLDEDNICLRVEGRWVEYEEAVKLATLIAELERQNNELRQQAKRAAATIDRLSNAIGVQEK